MRTRTRTTPDAVPGDEVVWTITAANVCDKAAEHVAVDRGDAAQHGGGTAHDRAQFAAQTTAHAVDQRPAGGELGRALELPERQKIEIARAVFACADGMWGV